jgi:hypothetical protein
LRLSLFGKIVGLASIIAGLSGVIILVYSWQRDALHERGAMRLAKIFFLEARADEADSYFLCRLTLFTFLLEKQICIGNHL